jgi:hypothetical protein
MLNLILMLISLAFGIIMPILQVTITAIITDSQQRNWQIREREPIRETGTNPGRHGWRNNTNSTKKILLI